MKTEHILNRMVAIMGNLQWFYVTKISAQTMICL